MMPLTMVFALSQFRVLNKYQITPDDE